VGWYHAEYWCIANFFIPLQIVANAESTVNFAIFALPLVGEADTLSGGMEHRYHRFTVRVRSAFGSPWSV
jgi:hypothetical protein